MQFMIENKGQIANSGIGAYLQGLDYSEHSYAVKIEPWTEKRRGKQNALSWVWYAELGAYSGNSVEDQHKYCKLHYGAPILASINEEFAEFYENTLLLMPYEIQLDMISFIPVTSLLTVKAFAEYLTTVERESAAQGCVLSRPDDSYWESMGVKK